MLEIHYGMAADLYIPVLVNFQTVAIVIVLRALLMHVEIGN